MRKKTLEILKPKKGEPSKAIISIDEELSFINGESIKAEILENFDKFDHLLIQANLVHIDLTGVQLLISIKKTCENAKKSLSSNIKMGDDLKTLVLKCGFANLIQ